MAQRPGTRYALGETVFDPDEGLLLHPDGSVGLPPKQLAVLRLLVEVAPRLVTREQLMDSVWADRVVGDAALTQAIKELRQALGDNAREPRFIATVARRGYRVVAEVTQLPPADAANGVCPPATSASPAEVQAPPPAVGPGGGVGGLLASFPALPELWRWVTLAVVAMAVLGAIPLVRVWRGEQRHRFTPRRAVAVLGFRDLRPSPESQWIGAALTEFVSGELAAGQRLRVLSAEEVGRVSREQEVVLAGLVGRPVPASTRAALAADVIVVGSYLVVVADGTQRLRVDVGVSDGASGNEVLRLGDDGAVEEVLAVVSRLGAAMRDRLGIGALSPGEESALLASRPGTVEAARLYAEGLSAMRTFNFTAAREFLARAAAVDPESPVIHAALSSAWSWMGYEHQETEEARRAWELSGSLSRAEQLAIEARHRERIGERQRAIEIGRALFEFFPDDLEIGLGLAISQAAAGQMAEAEVTLEVLRELPPPLGNDPRIDLAAAWFSDSKLDRKLEVAERTAEAAAASGARLLLAAARIQQGEAWMGLAQQDRARAAFQEALAIRQAAGDRWGVGKALLHVGRLCRDRCELDCAENALRQFLAVSTEVGSVWSQAEAHYEIGQVDAARGRDDGARASYSRALALFDELARPWGAARARLALADLDLAENQASKAAAAAAQVAASCRQSGLSENEAQAQVVSARSELALGNIGAARGAVAQARELLGTGTDHRLALRLRVVEAQVAAAEGRGADGLAALRSAAEGATRAGLAAIALEARLAAAEVALSLGRTAEARSELATLASEARRLGMVAIARRAAAQQGGWGNL